MLSQFLTKRNLIKIAFILGIWGFVAVIFTVKQSISAANFGKSFSFGATFIVQIVSCMGWVLLTPLIIYFAEKYMPIGKFFYRNLFLLLLVGILVIFLQTAYQTLTLPLTEGYSRKVSGVTFFQVYKEMFVVNWLLSASLYLMSLGVVLMITFYKKFQQRELQSTKLEANLSRARLQVMQMQLHPHFLFNTHNAITELIHKDPDTAERMLTNLSDLLRISLDTMETEEVTLQQELEFVKKYIEIEQVRFQERLKFNLNLSPETLDAIVPNMILQPLIENAVKHGISPLKQGGTIQINSYKNGESLFIKVSDDGVGLEEGEASFVIKGIGLANTQARLLHLYKDQQSFEINPEKEDGFVVLIKIPFRKEEEKDEKDIKLLNPT